MSRSQKPRKAYKRKPVQTDALTFLMNGDEPLEPALRTTILTTVHVAEVK